MFSILEILKTAPGDLTVNEIAEQLQPATNNPQPGTRNQEPTTRNQEPGTRNQLKKRIIYQLKILQQNNQVILTKSKTRIKTPIYLAQFNRLNFTISNNQLNHSHI